MSLSPAEVMALIAQLEADGALLHQMVHGGSAETVETVGGTVPSMAKFFADKGALIAAGFSATSTSEVTIGAGAKSFTVPAGKLFGTGQLVLVVDAANVAHWMLGSVTSYDDTTLTLAVTESEGAGTISSWILALCGQRGPKGIDGENGSSFTVDATGTLAGRDAYDAEAAGFAYLATDTSELYIRETATAGVWSDAIPFGKGDPGEPGINTWGSITGTLADQTDLQDALDGKADAAVLADKQDASSELDALAALTSTAFGRALLELANAAALRAAAQLVPGTDVQAYHANLAALAGLTLAANKLPYATGAGALALADLTAFARTLLDDADAATALATLGALAKDGSVSMTGALTLPADPTSALHAATKQYVDNLAAGLDVKPSCRLATTANDTLSGLAARDGITPVAGDRVLVTSQTSPTQNGIYIAAADAWARASDMDAWSEIPGALVMVETGTLYGDTGWISTADAGGTLGTTSIGWSRFFGTGLFQPTNANLTALAGLTLAANKLVYATGSGALALADLSSFVRGLMGAADGVSFQKSIGIREVLSASRTYYVRTDGSDSNNGLANTSGGAFATLQKAYDTIVALLDTAGYTVTVQVADGTYAAGVSMSASWTGGGPIVFQGNSATPTNVVIDATSSAFSATCLLPADVTIKDMRLKSSAGNAIENGGSGVIRFSGIDFGACGNSHVLSSANAAAVYSAGNYSISGSGITHMQAIFGGVIRNDGRTITISAAVTFSSAFAFAWRAAVIECYGNTFVNSSNVTGVKYAVRTNSVLVIAGATLPGTTAGSTTTGGQVE